MSLLSAPLDYTSATRQSAQQGIQFALQNASTEMALEKRQQEQTQNRIAGIEQKLSSMRGGSDALTPRQRQVFDAYYTGYKTLISEYADNPSQENLNRIFETIGSLETYINTSTGQYISDKKAMAEVYQNPSVANEGLDYVRQAYDQRHGEGGVFDEVRFDPETLSVNVSDSGFGVGERTNVLQHPLYAAGEQAMLLYTPKADTPRYISSQEYGASKAGLYDGYRTKERSSMFSGTASLEIQNNKSLQYSAIVEHMANTGLTEVDPMQVLTGEQYADYRQEAFAAYTGNGSTAMNRALNVQASRRNQQNSPYSSQSVSVTVGNQNYSIPLLKSPSKLLVDEAIGGAEAQAREVVIDGFQVLPNNAGMAIREVRQQKHYYERSTGNEITDAKAISNAAIAGNLQTTETPIFTTRIITDPGEYAGFVTALKRAELIK